MFYSYDNQVIKRGHHWQQWQLMDDGHFYFVFVPFFCRWQNDLDWSIKGTKQMQKKVYLPTFVVVTVMCLVFPLILGRIIRKIEIVWFHQCQGGYRNCSFCGLYLMLLPGYSECTKDCGCFWSTLDCCCLKNIKLGRREEESYTVQAPFFPATPLP